MLGTHNVSLAGHDARNTTADTNRSVETSAYELAPLHQELGAKALARAWGMALIIGAAPLHIDDDAMTCIARGDGVGLWRVVQDESPTREQLARWLRHAQSASGAAAIVLCAVDGCKTVVAAHEAGTSSLMHRTIASSDRRGTLELHVAGRDAMGAFEALLLGLEEVLGRRPIGRAFVRDFRQAWNRLAASWTGIPADRQELRRDLALITLTRILFLVFVQVRGWLDARPEFLREELAKAMTQGDGIYRGMFCRLFFGVLNTPIDAREGACERFGRVPYLNGGLFAEHALERAAPERDLPDEVLLDIFDKLFARYVFCATEAELRGFSSDPLEYERASVDPEMLGHVFEALMADEQRSASGSFYTPRRIVRRIVRDALVHHARRLVQRVEGTLPSPGRLTNGRLQRALEELFDQGSAEALPTSTAEILAEGLARVTILDPAAGSGAFIIGSFDALVRARAGLARRLDREVDTDAIRRHVATHNLYAVDLLPTAVRLCELRLWLALSVGLEAGRIEDVPPLPNLDLSLRQGDALLDVSGVDSILALRHAASNAAIQQQALRIEALKHAYLDAVGSHKARLSAEIDGAERRLFIGLLESAIAVFGRRLDALERLAAAPDLFGGPRGLGEGEQQLRAELLERREALRRTHARVAEHGHPYFSFGLHYAGVMRTGGFDIVLGNPPWVRPHHIDGQTKERLKKTYQVCHKAAWGPGARLGQGIKAGQVDLAAIFVERALQLVRPGGTVALLLPSKLFKALGSGGFRRLVADQAEVRSVVDWSRSPKRLFGATTYPALVVLERKTHVGSALAPPPGTSASAPSISVEVARGDRADDRFHMAPRQLSLIPGDAASPWVLAAPDARGFMEQMREAGPALGTKFELHRGIVSGCNRVFLPESVIAEPGSSLVLARFTSGEEAHIERSSVRPILRGCDVAPYSASVQRCVLYTHDQDANPLQALPRGVADYLQAHREALERRVDLKASMPPWTLFRTRADMHGPKVIWRDICTRLEAVYLGDEAHLPSVATGPALALNTLYYTPTRRASDGYLLTALLNSRVVRRFTQAIAEEATGGHYRFFSWVVGLVPWPFDEASCVLVQRIVQASRRLHGHAGPLEPWERRELLALVDGLVEEAYGQ